MLILSSATDALKVVTTTATTTIDIHASWIDNIATITPDNTNNAAVAGAATTTAVTGPSTGQRNVRMLSVVNTHASLSQVVNVTHTKAAGTAVSIFKCTLLSGEMMRYDDYNGFQIYDSAGGIKQVGRTGRYLRTTVLTSGTIFTTGPDTNTIFARLCGGGGQGGGCTIGSASISGAAGGGSAGGYAEKTFAVSPNTAYTYAIGAGGSTSGTGAVTGQVGGITTLAVGGVTVTANAGLGGLSSTSAATVTALGGAPPAVSTNGDVNASAMPGGSGFVSAVGVAVSGCGGTSLFGAGGNALRTQGTGNAGIGNGSGGGGACAIGAVSAVAGGAGTAGILIIDEFA